VSGYPDAITRDAALTDEFVIALHRHPAVMPLPPVAAHPAVREALAAGGVAVVAEHDRYASVAGSTTAAVSAARTVAAALRGRLDLVIAGCLMAPDVAVATAEMVAAEAEFADAEHQLHEAARSGDLDGMLEHRALVEVTLPARRDDLELRLTDLRMTTAATAFDLYTARRAALCSSPDLAVLCSAEASRVIGDEIRAARTAHEIRARRVIAQQQQRIARLADNSPPTLHSVAA
jgi:hypothetical protein